jgi:3-oxoacyl-[acyl-carrier protein] reductase
MNSNLSADDKSALADEIPAGRFGTPAEIARIAKQLTEAPSYLTGQIITVDGGWT